jgi:hypothetical protein
MENVVEEESTQKFVIEMPNNLWRGAVNYSVRTTKGNKQTTKGTQIVISHGYDSDIKGTKFLSVQEAVLFKDILSKCIEKSNEIE